MQKRKSCKNSLIRRLTLLSKRKEKIFDSIDETIGNTPLVRLNNIKRKLNLHGNIIAKLEFFNPLGSVKDRIGLAMINKAEKEKRIDSNTTIIEPTSGNTGISLAFICAARGYKLLLTMPNSMSLERKKMLLFLGAKIVSTPRELGMNGAIKKAMELKKKTPNSIILNQFQNFSNPEIHFQTTAQEIWDDCSGNIDNFMAGVGTGGTISGVGNFLKKKKSKVKIYAVEPEDSAVISGCDAGSHSIQGIGAGFIPKTLDMKIIDKTISISNTSAFNYSRILAKYEGITGGISSGAVLAAAVEINEKIDMKDKNTIIIIPSFAERYLSTDLFNDI
ncbi:MAG: cysteine synthase A [Rickettsiales bacterium]|nr:cysteine synthase A [Rickettsiales bacterium]